jgi:hypothetical protein
MKGHISEVALVESLNAKKARGGAGGRDGSFPLPPHRGHIIGRTVYSLFTDIEMLCQDIQLCHTACQLQFTVGDGACWIVGRHEPLF